MRKIIFGTLLYLLYPLTTWSQGYFPQRATRQYTSDSIKTNPPRPWKAALEVFSLNMGVWFFDRYVVNEDFARINWGTIKNNFKTGPVWDTDKFSTNLFAHPYHGSLYFNAARSNGLNFWQSIPYTAGGSLMWEFFMETEPPSINDMLATTFGGIELGEITYRLSDLFIDNRSHGAERVGREILAGIISPMRGINRLISGDAWKHRTNKGRHFPSVPVNFIITTGPRYLSELKLDQSKERESSVSMNISFHLDYGDPFYDEFYSPYEWFRFHMGIDLFSSQPLITQVNAIGALWGKRVWEKGPRTLTAGVFQHFDYYDSGLKSHTPYRISEAAAAGGGLIYYKRANNKDDKTDIFAEFYLNGVALGASISDYLKLGDRDYNLGSGFSGKLLTGAIYNKRLAFLINMENYQIFTWKGYNPDNFWDPEKLNDTNIQGNIGNARLTMFSVRLGYLLKDKFNISVSNRYFARRTEYKYYPTVNSSTYDVMLSLGIRL